MIFLLVFWSVGVWLFCFRVFCGVWLWFCGVVVLFWGLFGLVFVCIVWLCSWVVFRVVVVWRLLLVGFFVFVLVCGFGV